MRGREWTVPPRFHDTPKVIISLLSYLCGNRTPAFWEGFGDALGEAFGRSIVNLSRDSVREGERKNSSRDYKLELSFSRVGFFSCKTHRETFRHPD